MHVHRALHIQCTCTCKHHCMLCRDGLALRLCSSHLSWSATPHIHSHVHVHVHQVFIPYSHTCTCESTLSPVLQVNADIHSTSWKISLFMEFKEDNPEVLKGVSLLLTCTCTCTCTCKRDCNSCNVYTCTCTLYVYVENAWMVSG